MDFKNVVNKISQFEKVLLICSPNLKDKLISHFSILFSLKNIVYKTKSEVVNDLLGVYEILGRLSLQKEKNISPELAKILLNNSLLVSEDMVIYSNKVKELIEIKKRFNKYLRKNELISNLYSSRQIIIVDEYDDNDKFFKAKDILKSISSNIVYLYTNDNKHKDIEILEFKDYKEEVLFALKKIANLLESGVDANKIKIQIPNEYLNYANEVFTLSNISLNINSSSSLKEFEITKNIINELNLLLNENIDDAFRRVLEKYASYDNPILEKIVNIFNKYLKYDLKLEEIIADINFEFSNSKYSKKYIGGINVCNILENVVEEDDYIFILGFNQDVFPKTFKDEEYLLDFERKELGLLLSSDKNKALNEKVINTLNSINNLYLSYNATLNLASIALKLGSNLKIEKKENDYNVSYSKKLDEIALGKHLDLYFKYDIRSDALSKLYNMYPINNYKKYDNKFTGVNDEFYNLYLKDGITLSYTAIDKYNNCGFLFYLENVLKIRRVSNEESIFIGNLIHHLLYSVLNEDEIVDLKCFMNNVLKEYCLNEEISLNAKDEFFINKYIDTLLYLLDFISLHSKNSEFKIFGLEKEFCLDLDFDIDVKLKGKIDKILTLEINQQKYAIVVDYKSGSTDFDLNRVVHGLNMQIMFYFYFLNKTYANEFEFAGGYLQGVMPNSTFTFDSKKTYLDQLYEHFKLEGYSSSNIEVLKKIDKDIENESKFIKGIRFTKDGDFHHYSKSKVLSKKQFEKLYKLTEEIISTSTKNILSGIFLINPKKIGNSIDSCKYCPYKDICFREEKDYEILTDYKDFKFLEDEDDSN